MSLRSARTPISRAVCWSTAKTETTSSPAARANATPAEYEKPKSALRWLTSVSGAVDA
jgi:hypothetical protein